MAAPFTRRNRRLMMMTMHCCRCTIIWCSYTDVIVVNNVTVTVVDWWLCCCDCDPIQTGPDSGTHCVNYHVSLTRRMGGFQRRLRSSDCRVIHCKCPGNVKRFQCATFTGRRRITWKLNGFVRSGMIRVNNLGIIAECLFVVNQLRILFYKRLLIYIWTLSK